jgi:hypothetical protein
MRDNLRMERPTLILLQETKLEEKSKMEISKRQWKHSSSIVVSSRGPFTIWDPIILDLHQHYSTQHWLFTVFDQKQTGKTIHIFNIYAQVSYRDK